MEGKLESSSYFHHPVSDPQKEYGQEISTVEAHSQSLSAPVSSVDEVRKIRKTIQKHKLSKITKESSSLAQQRVSLRNNSVRKIQLQWRKFSFRKESKRRSLIIIQKWVLGYHLKRRFMKCQRSAQSIQRYWRRYQKLKEDRLMLKFTQYGRWKLRQSNIVFAVLLGHLCRRRILQTPAITKARLSLHDAWTVLEGLVADAHHTGLTVHRLISDCSHDQSVSDVKSIDWPFARMFAKEVLVNRGIIWRNMIGNRCWSPLPSPGYHFYPPTAKIPVMMTTNHQIEYRNAELNSEQQSECRHDMFENELDGKTILIEPLPSQLSDLRGKIQKNAPPQPLSEILKARGSAMTDDRFKVDVDAFELSIQPKDRFNVRDYRPATAPAVHSHIPQTPIAPIPMVSIPKRRKLNSSKPHLQVDVILAEKIVPVKGKPIGGVTDRKPGFRVSLFLPLKYITGGDSDHSVTNPIKMVHSFTHDSQTETLFPVWNQTIYVNLPIPTTFSPTDADSWDQLLSEYWSLGFLKIEVLDGERFHEDIFLGEATLYLSSLWSDKQRRDQSNLTSSVKSTGGVLPLCKRNPTERVTGTVTAIGYLHMPIGDGGDESIPNQKKGQVMTTPPSKRAKDKIAISPILAENISLTNNQPLNEKSTRCSTPPSSEKIKHALQRVSPVSAGADGLTASERRRRKNTPQWDHQQRRGDLTEDSFSATPVPINAVQSSQLDSIGNPRQSQLRSHQTQQDLMDKTQRITGIAATDNSSFRPSTAPTLNSGRQTRITEQFRKLESLANTLQFDADIAMQSLNKKLLDRKEEKKVVLRDPIESIPEVIVETKNTEPEPSMKPSQFNGPKRKIVLAPRDAESGRTNKLEDADLLLENLGRRLEKKSIK